MHSVRNFTLGKLRDQSFVTKFYAKCNLASGTLEWTLVTLTLTYVHTYRLALYHATMAMQCVHMSVGDTILIGTTERYTCADRDVGFQFIFVASYKKSENRDRVSMHRSCSLLSQYLEKCLTLCAISHLIILFKCHQLLSHCVIEAIDLTYGKERYSMM